MRLQSELNDQTQHILINRFYFIMGNTQCCDVREEITPEFPLIQRQKLQLQAVYQIAPEAQSKYKALVKKYNDDLFLEVSPSSVGNAQIQQRQGFTFLSNINAYYSGQWNHQNKPQGRGRIIFKNGSLLVGKFKQFKCNYENCHYIFKDGSYYNGAIKDNKLCGKGKFVNKILEYEGQWEHNLPNGRGEEFMGNGDRYLGTFIKGKKHGTNCFYKWFYHKTFAEYTGNFEEGLIRGKGTLKLKNSCKLQGIFNGQSIENITLKSQICKYTGSIIKGKLQGKGTLQILPRSQVFKGTYKQGQLYGLCIHVDSKGRKNECFIFKKNKLTKVVGLSDHQISEIIKGIEEVYSRLNTNQDALKQLNHRFNGQYLCELTEPFSIQSSHNKYMVINFNRHTIRILAGP